MYVIAYFYLFILPNDFGSKRADSTTMYNIHIFFFNWYDGFYSFFSFFFFTSVYYLCLREVQTSLYLLTFPLRLKKMKYVLDF